MNITRSEQYEVIKDNFRGPVTELWQTPHSRMLTCSDLLPNAHRYYGFMQYWNTVLIPMTCLFLDLLLTCIPQSMKKEDFLTQVQKVYLRKIINCQYQKALSNFSLDILFLWENDTGDADVDTRNCMKHCKRWY